MIRLICGTVGAGLLAGLALPAQAQTDFASEALLYAMTCNNATSSTLSKSTICVLENQKLDEAFEALALPTYDDVAAYHENAALISVLGAGFVFEATGGVSEASCRRTIAAHRHFTQMPEPEKLSGNLPEIAAGLAPDSPACLQSYPDLDPPVLAGEDSLSLQLGRMTTACETAYFDLDDNAAEICAVGFQDLTNAQVAIGEVSPVARDTASFWRAHQGQMMIELQIDTVGEAAVCEDAEAIWASFHDINPAHIFDPVVASEILSTFSDTIAYCRETYTGGATTPVLPQPRPEISLADLSLVSTRARVACSQAIEGLPASVVIEVCREWLGMLEASKSAAAAVSDTALELYWLALADIHANLATAFEFIDQTHSARTCFQAEKAGMNISTLRVANVSDGYVQASAARETAERLVPQCRQAFAKPGWGATDF